MKISGQNWQQQYLLALVECLIDVRLGKNVSVHIRRPVASSYWKSNWSDTCIFELNEPGFSIHSFWVGVTPACKLGTETKNWTSDESPSEQGLPPHIKAVCRQNISFVAFSNGDLEKKVETCTMNKCETSLRNEEKGRARHSMCERQDENAMENKFQFNWIAT